MGFLLEYQLSEEEMWPKMLPGKKAVLRMADKNIVLPIIGACVHLLKIFALFT